MGKRPPKKTDPYFLDPGFERGMVTLACTNRRFWGRVGHALDLEALSSPEAKLAVRAAAQIAKDNGQGPESGSLVLQRLRRWMAEDGRVKLEEVQKVAGYFAEACDEGLPSEEAAVTEMVPLLQRRLKADVMRLAIEDYGRDGNFTQTLKTIDKANRIGEVEAVEQDPRGILLSAVKPERIRWLWRGRIPLGKLTILDGPPGLGKSTVTIDIAARLTSELPMPGEAEAYSDPFGVVLINMEDGLADTMLPRLLVAGGTAERCFIPFSDRVPNLSDAADLSKIEEAIREHRARLVVVDPLSAVLGGKTDSHKDQDIRRVLAPLAKVAERTGCAVVLVRHLRKSAEGGALNAGQGTIGIIGAARSGLMVGKDPDNPEHRILAATKSNVGKLAPAMRFVVVEGRAILNGEAYSSSKIEWLGECETSADDLVSGGSSRPAKLEAAKEFLTRELAAGERCSAEIEDLAELASISHDTLKRAKKSLGVRAHKRPDGTWVISLVDPPLPPLPPLQ